MRKQYSLACKIEGPSIKYVTLWGVEGVLDSVTFHRYTKKHYEGVRGSKTRKNSVTFFADFP